MMYWTISIDPTETIICDTNTMYLRGYNSLCIDWCDYDGIVFYDAADISVHCILMDL